jgi:general secretion pathway protein F
MRFNLKAVNGRQDVVALELDAADEAAAREAALRRGLSVLTIRGAGLAAAMPLRRKSTFPSTLFSIELLALLDAGLNLVEALQALAEKQAGGDGVLQDVLRSLNEGLPFSQALARRPEHFSALYVATIVPSGDHVME